MRALAATILSAVMLTGCLDDRIILTQGDLGPAVYHVEVSATQNDLTTTHRVATLRIVPDGNITTFTFETDDGAMVEADIEVTDGGLELSKVRGAGAEDETDLAALVGQLRPLLPDRPVRIGEAWTSVQRIDTPMAAAQLETELRMVAFRRLAGNDAAELVGTITGDLESTGANGPLSGPLSGSTVITWAIGSGRVLAYRTELTWSLASGEKIELITDVSSG